LDQGSIAEPIAPAPAPDPLGSGVLGESGLDKPDESVKVVVSDKVPDLAKTGGMITYSAPIAFGLALLSIAFLSTFIKREEKPKG
jgi:LPXTG-motif cell wall-anchored protein